jgi:hypothetical protein
MKSAVKKMLSKGDTDRRVRQEKEFEYLISLETKKNYSKLQVRIRVPEKVDLLSSQQSSPNYMLQKFTSSINLRRMIEVLQSTIYLEN